MNSDNAGSQHGSHKSPGVTFEKPVSLKNGKNDISLLSVMVGSPVKSDRRIYLIFTTSSFLNNACINYMKCRIPAHTLSVEFLDLDK